MTERETAAVLANQRSFIFHSSTRLFFSSISSSTPAMSSSPYPQPPTDAGPSTARSQGYYRPATIAELAAQAQENLWDPAKGLKHWLRTAEKARRNAEQLVQARDYEGAFIEYAKAATIVLEKLPTHSEYTTLLSVDQRQNLGLVSAHSSTSSVKYA